MTQENEKWDETYDIVVVGSGAGALTSSIVAADGGAKVLVVEKADKYGGTSALSGAGLWIPNNKGINRDGDGDSFEDSYQYVKGLVHDDVADAKVRTYVDQAHRMIDYLETHTDARFESVPYADYFPEDPGGRTGHRTMQPVAFYSHKLGKEANDILFSEFGSRPLQISFTISESRKMMTREKGWWMLFAKHAIRYVLDVPYRLKGRRDRRFTFGSALIGHLRYAMNKRNIPLVLETPMKSLIEEDGVVTGIVVEQNGKVRRIRATKGVILGAGGFEHNKEMREKYLPKPTKAEWSGGNVHNTGDAIQAGMKLGAAIDLMDAGWWGPAVPVAGEPRARILFSERALPGCVVVNQAGKRFANEALPYLDMVTEMYDKDVAGAGTIPSFVIIDSTFRRKYHMGPVMPSSIQPDISLSQNIKDVLHKADTIEELADKINVPKEALVETIAQMNKYAEDGKDPDFGKGESAYDRYYGDTRTGGNPCLAPVDSAPFYAMAIYPGDIGTKGGLLTNEHAQVLREDGAPIAGLYAIGNTSASVMGRQYPGAGSTIGPAMTHGYLAARHATGSNI